MRARPNVFCCFKPILTAALLSLVAASSASAQSTAFTYQGSLDDGGAPASGLHDFRFRLFSVAAGGTPIGSMLCVDNVNVVEGRLTVQLDFGQQFATTAQRHLEIDVDATPADTAACHRCHPHEPRQQLTATPMASLANSAGIARRGGGGTRPWRGRRRSTARSANGNGFLLWGLFFCCCGLG
jgi:hypothetical protein